MQEIIMKVKGIECAGCENRIQNTLSKIEKVESVKADHNTGIVTVVTEEALISAIQEKLEDLGFTVIEVTPCKKSS